VSPRVGLSFVGLPWLYKRKSALLHGVDEDAEYVVGQLTRIDAPT
jgi:putative flavoprotein involved in K+ transport